MTQPKRLNTLIPKEIWDKLKNLSIVNSKPMTEILKDAILLEDFVEGVCRDGGTIIVKHADGTMQELFKILL